MIQFGKYLPAGLKLPARPGGDCATPRKNMLVKFGVSFPKGLGKRKDIHVGRCFSLLKRRRLNICSCMYVCM